MRNALEPMRASSKTRRRNMYDTLKNFEVTDGRFEVFVAFYKGKNKFLLVSAQNRLLPATWVADVFYP